MKEQIKTTIVPALLGVGPGVKSPPGLIVSRGNRHRTANCDHRSSLAHFRFRSDWPTWVVIACLCASLTQTSAQERLGLHMPSLEPQPVTTMGMAPPSLMPGETRTFMTPDAVEGTNNPAVIGLTGYIAGQTPLRAFAYTIAPLQSSSASAFQYNDFAIPASSVVGSITDSVVSAQISGSVSVRGFLFAMKAAEATAGVDVELLDITDTNAPIVISSHQIADYEADDRLSPAVGGGLDVDGEGGFPFVGVIAGGSIDASLQLSPMLRFVRDDQTYGFMALLRRGHVYRVQIELSVDTSDRVAGGTAIASFFSPADGGPVMPNVFDPNPAPGVKGAENSWLSLLDPMAGRIPDLQIAKGEADVVSRSLKIAGIDYQTSIWNNSDSDVVGGIFGFLSPGEQARMYHGADLFNVLSPKLPLTMNGLVLGSPFLAVRNLGKFETIPLPGVGVEGPTITLGNDEVALAEQATDREIEEHLKRNDILVSLYLPAAFGGELERCMDLVKHLIRESKAAGYSTREARKYLALAVEAQGQAEYKLAYEQLHTAYARLTGEPRREAGNR